MAIREYDIPVNKFIKGQVLQILNLIFSDYIRLKENGISIISNNCRGGIVYNTLGIECCLPYENLFVLDNNYIKLLYNLKHYDYTYPVFWDDIKIHCNHASDIDQAVEDWDRRKKKINYENLFLEMYTESKQVARKFCDLTIYQKKICFVPFEDSGAKDLLKLPILEGQSEFWETVNSNAAIGTNGIVYHLVDLLLYGQVQCRIARTNRKEERL